MSETKTPNDDLQEHMRSGQPSADPDYLAWKKKKIQTGFDQSKDRSKLIPANKVWDDIER